MSRRRPIPTLRQSGLCLALLAPLATTTGCSLFGGAIGAATPRTEPMKVGLNGPLPAIGEEVSVLVKGAGGFNEWIDGRYEGVREGALLLSTDGGERAIAFGSIRKLRVHRGTYVKEGFGVGLLIDAVVILLGVAVVTSAHPR